MAGRRSAVACVILKQQKARFLLDSGREFLVLPIQNRASPPPHPLSPFPLVPSPSAYQMSEHRDGCRHGATRTNEGRGFHAEPTVRTSHLRLNPNHQHHRPVSCQASPPLSQKGLFLLLLLGRPLERHIWSLRPSPPTSRDPSFIDLGTHQRRLKHPSIPPLTPP